ncbi:hypothetical protein [Amycolatopsis taiwanensis]|uniref:hypothetical protein n=1 Tax=Amycolatopsis taiwanensis TaxID=342230 RepID=UPI0012ECAB46|nr:hypothetical protein [Amycolatopsis taiwanensis]
MRKRLTALCVGAILAVAFSVAGFVPASAATAHNGFPDRQSSTLLLSAAHASAASSQATERVASTPKGGGFGGDCTTYLSPNLTPCGTGTSLTVAPGEGLYVSIIPPMLSTSATACSDPGGAICATIGQNQTGQDFNLGFNNGSQDIPVTTIYMSSTQVETLTIAVQAY